MEGIPWLQLQAQQLEHQPAEVLLQWQRLEEDCGCTFNLNAVDLLAVPCQVQQHTVGLVLLPHNCSDAAQCQQSCLVQPAVGPGCTEHAALVCGCTALQHR
jgi:hypothetical protein